jgi:hypothetical protein
MLYERRFLRHATSKGARVGYDFDRLRITDLPQDARAPVTKAIRLHEQASQERTVNSLTAAGDAAVPLLDDPRLTPGFGRLVACIAGESGQYLYEWHRAEGLPVQVEALRLLSAAIRTIEGNNWVDDDSLNWENQTYCTTKHLIEMNIKGAKEHEERESRRPWWRR